jgi:hypothetical protein
MKLFDIVNETVDMRFWKELDDRFNPEALDQIKMQERRSKALKAISEPGSTPVFTKPVRKPADAFKPVPEKGFPTSPGYRGNVATAVKAGHISPEKGRKLIDNN